MAEEQNEIDIEELETILGIENKSGEIQSFLSQQNPNPSTFLQAISLISNSNQFGTDIEDAPIQEQVDIINDLIKNASDFFLPENNSKFKIDFSEQASKNQNAEYEIIVKEAKANQNKTNNKNNNNNAMNNNPNNNNNNKEEKRNKKIKKEENNDKKDANQDNNNNFDDKQEEIQEINDNNNNINTTNNINETEGSTNKNEKRRKSLRKRRIKLAMIIIHKERIVFKK